jgi:hypothetical protein
MAGGNAHQRRLLRRLYEQSPFSDPQPDTETLSSWFAKTPTKIELGMLALSIWLGVYGHPYVAASCLSALVFLLLSGVFGTRWFKNRFKKVARVSSFILTNAILIGSILYFAWSYVNTHTPFCYGFFYSGDPGPTNKVHFGIANPTKATAENVRVTIADVSFSGSPFDTLQPLSPPISLTIPAVYPEQNPVAGSVATFTPENHWFAPGTAFIPTDVSLEFSELRKSYQVTLIPTNGEAVLQSISLKQEGKFWQCTTIKRLSDGKAIASDVTPAFDDFGGVQHSVPCHAADSTRPAVSVWYSRFLDWIKRIMVSLKR